MLVRLLVSLILIYLSSCSFSSEEVEIITIDKSFYIQDLDENTDELNKKSAINEVDDKPIEKKIEVVKTYKLPVNASIIDNFSSELPGIIFNTKYKEPVRAINKGKVVYINDDKIGEMVIIIRHPLGFYSVYNNNYEILVAKGDYVNKSKVIATTSKKPFYFEMKKFKTPINPINYLE